MNDPKRLLEEGPSELERSLLQAVAAEQPSLEHRMRVREVMGLAPRGAPALAGTVTRSGMGRLAIAGIVAAGAVAALLLLGRTRPTTPPFTPPVTPPAQEAVLAPATPETGVAAPAPAIPSTVDVPDPGAASHPARHSAAATTPLAGSDIREQIRLIDEARAAVAAHDEAAALRALDQYRSKFPSGALDQEATVLRIEALDQKGDHAQAASMARAFLARNPASAHATRLGRIAGQ